MAASNLNDPVPDSVIVHSGGLDWVWASPCADGGCTSGLLVGKDGFGYATAAQWQNRPPNTAFYDPANNVDKCATPWFDSSYDYCDYSDADSGYYGSAPSGGLPAGNDGLQPMDPLGDTWLVRVTPDADTTAPVCGSLTVAPDGHSATISPSDAGSGIASISNLKISNGTGTVSTFNPGDSSVTITVTKTDPALKTVFRFDVIDVASNVTQCS